MLNLKPQKFSDPYAHVTNQISHVALSFTVIWLTNALFIIMAAWLVWETYHFFLGGRDYQDFAEDLGFEWSGGLIFVEPSAVFIVIVALAATTYMRVR